MAPLPYPRSSAQGIDIQWWNRGVAGLCCNARRNAIEISLKIRAKKRPLAKMPIGSNGAPVN
jgi:hypothetical protein